MTPIRPRLPRSTVIDRPIYTISLEHWTIEELAAGRCPEGLAQEAHRLLRWHREAIRARTHVSAPPHAKQKKPFVGRG